MRPLLLCLALLAAPAALAQQNTWTVTAAGGAAVMEETTSLFFTVTNTSTAAASRIAAFTLGIPPGPYDVEGGAAPPGWRVSAVDKQERKVTYTFVAGCPPAGTGGLGPGQSGLFEVRVTGFAFAADQLNHALVKNRTDVTNTCSSGNFGQFGGGASWTLHGLSSRVEVSPRSLDIGGDVTVTLTVANRTTATQSAVVPAAPTVGGAATFSLVSGPAPALVNNLAPDAVASFSWVYRATSRGVSAFTVRAGNGTATSPPGTSLDVSVGAFPASATVLPEAAINGETVTLLVQVSNHSGSTLSQVRALTPTVTSASGATATRLSGPTPATVRSLAAGASTGFTFTYRVNGAPGDSLTFTVVGEATAAPGVTVQSDPVRSATVRLSELTLTPAPRSVLSGAGATTLAFTVRNGGSQAISSVVVLTADPALFSGPSATAIPAGWTAANSTNPRGIRFTASSAASYLPAGGAQTFTIAYTGIGTVTAPTPSAHRVQATFSPSGATARADTVVTVATTRAIPDVTAPTALATPGNVQLAWNNPSLHYGALVLRSTGAPPNTAPTPGREYSIGAALGNATVVYADAYSFAGGFTDTAVVDGQTYYYRLHNRDEYAVYAPGNTPAASPSNHLLVVVPTTAGNAPLWCYSVGMPALQQPYTDLGKAVYQSSNGAFFTGNLITAGAPDNGSEKWRPSLTRGVVQARPTAQKVGGEADPSLFVGDHLGYAYRISSTSGAIAWTGNGAAPLGEVIQAQAVVALRQYASPAFQAAFPTDLVFFATRNAAAGSNSVRALRADTGAQAWSYQPGDLGQVTGPPLYDGVTQTLWVGSLGGSGATLRVLDVVNPATPLLTVTDLADLPAGVVRNGSLGQALVVDRTGKARGYKLSDRSLVWEVALGGTVTAPPVPYLTDFFVASTTGLQRYHVDTATGAVTPVWGSPVALSTPTSPRLDTASGKLFVGGGDGFVRRVDMATGAVEASVRVSTVGGTSMPSLDSTAGLQRLYVGTADGRLCALPPSF